MPFDLIPDIAGLDLGHAELIVPQVAEAIAPGGDYRIDTRSWTHCDLSGVAVLLSALRSAEAIGARLAIEMPPDGLVMDRMRACGIDPDTQLEMHEGRAIGLRTGTYQGT
ncbi:STAS domain-containing protein [Rhodovulum euryhalinum]|uniref:STAS domain-containing protein n=1 Tax=Rhodovulum euryhalinum TaxID=35805 RepID=A0A4R2KNG1_9RHOB|nr:STAS domain-containing protein [Rhodovulum euryhalinum]TCO71608.1 STAS domain-containing protein [Rhodovulum euryhalinum]